MDHERVPEQVVPKPQPPVWLLIALLLEAALHLLLPIQRWLPMPWDLLGLLPLAAGLWLNLRADADLKRHVTTVKSGLAAQALVSEGAYGLSRHPMYLGFVLLAAGVALLLGSLTPWLAVLGLWAILAWRYVRREEQLMASTFGDGWRAYCARVRRWL